jgi:hypothetical protein
MSFHESCVLGVGFGQPLLEAQSETVPRRAAPSLLTSRTPPLTPTSMREKWRKKRMRKLRRRRRKLRARSK